MGRKLSAIAIALCMALAAPARAADALAADALGPDANTAYLSTNAAKPGVVSLPSGLQYRVVKSGIGRKPRPADIVQIDYSARLINGTLVDGTSAGLPAPVQVSGVIAGLGQALQMMREGDHWQLVLPARLGFGARSTPGGNIPANQTLVFDVTLVAIAPPAAQLQPDNSSPISVYAAGREEGATFTIHP